MNIPWGQFTSQIMYWAGLLIFAVAIFVVFYGLYYFTSYPIKMLYWPVVGSGKDGYLALDKPKKARFRYFKDAWKMMFKKKQIKPFPPEYVYPGRNVYAFKVGDEFHPARVTYEGTSRAVMPIPHEVKNWAMMDLQSNQNEFAKPGLWDNNKYVFMTIICVGICCAIAGVTVYYTYKFGAQQMGGLNEHTEALKGFTGALKNFATANAPN